MTEMRRKLGIRERSVGLLGPPSNRNQNARRHNMSVRSVGHQSPPTLMFGFQYNVPKANNHKGIGIGLTSAFGNPAKTFVAPINAPPKVFKMQSGMEVCTT